MNNQYRFGTIMSLAMLSSFAISAEAQQATINGLITGRSGSTMSVKTEDSPRITVVLSDTTRATENGNFLGIGKKNLGVTALVPGLSVKIEGSYDPDHQFLAQKITFSRNSLQTAKQIDAGLNPTAQQLAAAQDQLRTDGKNIENAQNGIDANSKDIASTRQDLSATQQLTDSNGKAIGTANNRFGTLDTYEAKGNITVNFANGKATVSPKDRDQLTEFVKTAGNTPGYMIQVQGYASATGSPTANQKLSAERADAVLAIIQQTGAVPLTRILAPAAMGVSEQVENNHTRSGQAQNRRVVVTILVNKGITG